MNDPLIIDISHWRLNDKNFQEERKAKWPMVEEVLSICLSKNKKAINVIKKFYQKGDLPEWSTINNATDSSDRMFRHLDIATFLWLHPSTEIEVLLPLAKAYYAGNGRLPQDIQAGIHFLFHWGVFLTIVGRGDWKAKCSSFDGKGRLLFNLIFHDFKDNTFFMEVKGIYRTETHHEISIPNWTTFELSTRWLCIKKVNSNGYGMILQFKEILDFTFKMINLKSDETLSSINSYAEGATLALYRIAYFDTEKEGDTPRTHYVNNVRKILDEDNHLPEIESLWEKVKSNEITVENPWKL